VAARRLRLKTIATVAAIALVAVAVAIVSWRYLFRFPNEPMVDLQVYQRAGDSVRGGGRLYEDVDSRLVFTYPPFAALVAVIAAPFSGWLARFTWTLATVAALWGVVVIAFRPLLGRCDDAIRPLVVGALVTTAVLLHPTVEHIFFGQVNVFLVLLCLVDLLVVRRRAVRGALVGIATAVKLTPGVFVVHLWTTGRRRAALTAVAVAAGCTALAFVVVPRASVDFWTREVFEGERVTGSITYTSNQSLLGVVARAVPGAVGTAIWVVVAVTVAWIGFGRAKEAYRAGDQRGGVALTALLAVLLSPVAWIHHFVWFIPVLGALVADGRSRRRTTGAVLVALVLLLRLPWWGWALLDEGPMFGPIGVLMHNAYALVALGLLIAYPIRPREPGTDPVAGTTRSVPGTAH
jgi:alpha-1,2-mannosyltransferase